MNTREAEQMKSFGRAHQHLACLPPRNLRIGAADAVVEFNLRSPRQASIPYRESIAETVLWTEPKEKPSRGSAVSGYEYCPPGFSHRVESRPEGDRSRWGVEQPGPGAKRDDAYPIHDQCIRHFYSPMTHGQSPQNSQEFSYAVGGPERLIHDTDGRQTHLQFILR